MIADFLLNVCENTARPESTLKNTSAALGNMYEALNVDNPLSSPAITHLKSAIIKSGTSEPMKRSKVIPVKPFVNLFLSMADNYELSIENLRLKCVTLLALCAMLRPSDIAPKAIHYDPDSDSLNQFSIKVSDVQFEDNAMIVTFHGIKNDSQRRGYIVTIQGATQPVLCPVRCMKAYISRTMCNRSSQSDPVFLTLHRPYRAISASTVSNILLKSLQLAGLHGYAAKDFRPTGATAAVEAGFDEHSIMKVGRWKSSEVFREHYVHNKIPTSFTDKILEK